MSAVWITLSRFPLLLVSVLAFYFGSPTMQLGGAAVLFAGLLLDSVDGMVARRTGQSSLFGGILDIAADRTYELVLWVGFADLGLIPAWIPMLILVRTTLTDAFRSLGVSQGVAPFDQHVTRPGRFLVASPAMRITYSVAKVTTFCGLPLIRALAMGKWAQPVMPGLDAMVGTALYLTVGLCVLRGLPVIVGVPRRWVPALQPGR